MDNVTHALAGCVIGAVAAAIVERRSASHGSDRANGAGLVAESSVAAAKSKFPRIAAILGIVTAELPDLDLLYAGQSLGTAKLGYLLHHRGYTHTVVFAVLGAFVCWMATLMVSQAMRQREFRFALLAVAVAGTVSHIALDFTNTYGVHPFWPVDGTWYYGDAVFIIEPWLWVIAIPPLLFAARRRYTQIIHVLLLAIILGAAWRVSMVGRTVALVLTSGAFAWTLFNWKRSKVARLAGACLGWIAVEAVFVVSGMKARAIVRDAVGETSFRDVALSPDVGNPLCYSGIVLERVGDTIRTTNVSVASHPSIHDGAGCARRRDNIGFGALSTKDNTNAIVWGTSWSASRAELMDLVHTNCEIAAVMRFVRIPIWRDLPGNVIQFSDQRYSEGAGGFASINTARHPVQCPAHVPGWGMPRADLLE